MKKLLKNKYKENLDWLEDVNHEVFWIRIDLIPRWIQYLIKWSLR